jgi:hypothetical protein
VDSGPSERISTHELASPSDPPSGTGSGRPWLSFLLILLALFGSGGLNVYLGWITWDTYRRYRQVVAQLHATKFHGEAG